MCSLSHHGAHAHRRTAVSRRRCARGYSTGAPVHPAAPRSRASIHTHASDERSGRDWRRVGPGGGGSRTSGSASSTVVDLCRPAAPVGAIGARRRRSRPRAGRPCCPGDCVVSANVEPPCDVLVAPGPLPFADGAFDVVSEHRRARARSGAPASCTRRRAGAGGAPRVVVCFPCGSDTKDASETAARRPARAREYGVRFDFLDEHLACGLPRVARTSSLRSGTPRPTPRCGSLYQDGVAEAEQLLLDAVGAVKGRRPGAAAPVRAGLAGATAAAADDPTRRRTTTGPTWSSTSRRQLPVRRPRSPGRASASS